MSAEKTRSPITTHVLDVSRGRAASGVGVTLEMHAPDGSWRELARGATNPDGRTEGLLPPGSQVQAGVYRLSFATGAYFRGLGAATFFPETSIVFEITRPDEHHHVPLLLSPFGYSTYRGT